MSSDPLLETMRLAEGLWRWSVPHPEWTPAKDRPGGWGRMVACVYSEPAPGSPDPVVLIDPLAPPEGSAEAATFWSALDRDLERAERPVVILLGNFYHLRSALEVRRRYLGTHGASIHAHADAVARLGFEPDRRFGPKPDMLAGIDRIPIEGLDLGETVFFIRRHRALVFSDAVIGTGGGRCAVPPASWAAEGEVGAARYREHFRASIERLVALDPVMLLTSHGAPVMTGGRQALADAVAAPAWGDQVR